MVSWKPYFHKRHTGHRIREQRNWHTRVPSSCTAHRRLKKDTPCSYAYAMFKKPSPVTASPAACTPARPHPTPAATKHLPYFLCSIYKAQPLPRILGRHPGPGKQTQTAGAGGEAPGPLHPRPPRRVHGPRPAARGRLGGEPGTLGGGAAARGHGVHLGPDWAGRALTGSCAARRSQSAQTTPPGPAPPVSCSLSPPDLWKDAALARDGGSHLTCAREICAGGAFTVPRAGGGGDPRTSIACAPRPAGLLPDLSWGAPPPLPIRAS